MRRFLAGLALVTSGLAAAQPQERTPPLPASPYVFPKAAPESVGMTTKALEELDSVVRGYVERDEAVGAELMVIKGRRTVWHSAHGFADREGKKELKPGSIYCVRSMTKPVAGTAVQMLIDDGRLALSDPAAKFLPGFDSETHRGITVEHLLTHSSGLPLSSLLATDHRALTSVQDVAGLAAKAELVGAPGEKFNYSDDGTDTLTAIVEKVSGKKIEDFLQERLLGPLGMRDTMPVARKDDARVQKMVPLYVGNSGAWTKHWAPGDDPLFPYFLGSQALYSTCEDYARFLCLWADGGQPGSAAIGKRLLSAEAVKRGLTPAREMGYPSGFTGLRTDYGQLWMLYIDPTATPPERVVFGHGGSDGTQGWMWPRQDLIVLYFTQSRGGLTSLSIEKEIDRILLGGRAEQAQDFGPFVGMYWDAEEAGYRAVMERDGKLNVEIPGEFFGVIVPGAKPGHWKLELNPKVELIFHREGDGPADLLEVKTGKGRTELKRVTGGGDLPTAEAVIKRVVAAHGTDKFGSVGAIRRTGKTEMPALKRKFSIVHLIDGPRMRVDLSPEGSPGQSIICDGERVWNRPAGGKAEELSPALSEQTRLEHPISAFGDWRRDYADVAVVGRGSIEGEAVIVVRCLARLGHPTAMYVSEESGLVLAQDKITVVAGLGAVGVSISYGDFREVGTSGITMPFRNRIVYSSKFLGEAGTVIESAEVGVATAADTFSPGT